MLCIKTERCLFVINRKNLFAISDGLCNEFWFHIIYEKPSEWICSSSTSLHTLCKADIYMFWQYGSIDGLTFKTVCCAQGPGFN